MARINQASLRAQLDDCRARFDAIKQKGEASADTIALIDALFLLVDIVVAVFLEKTTPKTSRNSSLPSPNCAWPQHERPCTSRRVTAFDFRGCGVRPISFRYPC